LQVKIVQTQSCDPVAGERSTLIAAITLFSLSTIPKSFRYPKDIPFTRHAGMGGRPQRTYNEPLAARLPKAPGRSGFRLFDAMRLPSVKIHDPGRAWP
jgi:hypothetical protein